jgi:uncharacterized membrane protein
MPPAAREAARDGGPMARLKSEAGGLLDALAERATSVVRERVQDATSRLTDYAQGDGSPGLIAAITGAKSMAEGKGPVRSMLGAGFAGARQKVKGIFGGGGGDGGGGGKSQGRQKLKLTNIVETIDVGAPIRLVYDQWTQFGDFPTFMKKVESVDQPEDQKMNWKAQVFWSHRTWEATILDQHPEDKIVWRSKGPKGHVDGAVTFHELASNLTRILVVLEYHPQGMFERTGNLWRAQGRRVRLELKHFRRHVMAHDLLKPDEVEGWRGVIEDGQVVKDQETALREEQEARERQDGEETRDREPAAGEAAAGEAAEEAGSEEPEQGEEQEEEEPAEGAEEEEPEEEPVGARASGDGRGGRRPAAARAGHGEDRPQRGARQGAARDRVR